MQKFGLDNLQTAKLGALELEIIREKATALGRAGKRLRLSVEVFESAKLEGFPDGNEAALLREVADSLYGLMIQREFIGFTEGNLDWIRKYYSIPDEAMAILGVNGG